MIKVAFFAEILIQEFDGASRTMFQLINRIDKRTFEYLFVCGRSADGIDKGFQTFHVPFIRTPVNADYSISIPQFASRKLVHRLDAFDPDVIHIATPSLLGFFALRYAQRRNIPVITVYHTHFIAYLGYYFRNTPFLQPPAKQVIQSSMRRFYNGCDKIYVPTKRIIHELEALGIDRRKLQLWKRGVDLQQFNAGQADRYGIQKIIGNDKPNILFVSRLVWEKNLAVLAAIYQLIQESDLACNFLVVGDGVARQELERRMSGALFLGKQDHATLAKIYASADIFVFPSISETYGNVVVEAMASGLPCVIADGGGSGELVVHGRTGFKCSSGDPQEYLRYINEILSNSRLRNDIRRHAWSSVRQLDWAQLAATYFQDIHTLSKQGASLAYQAV